MRHDDTSGLAPARRPPWRRRGFALLLIALLLAAVGLLVPPAETAAATTTSAQVAATAAEPAPVLVVYWGEGCPRCAAEKEFLAQFQRAHPRLRVELYEVYEDAAGRQRFQDHAERLGFDATAVPATVLDERVWIGFTKAIEEDLRRTLGAALAGEPVPAGVYGGVGQGTCSSKSCEAEPAAAVDVPLLGQVDLGGQSLVVSTLAIGFVDGINPCSLWVISVLLAIVIRTGSRRRVLATGSVFLAVTAAMYALYMAGLYGALTLIGYMGAIQVAVALAAGVFGVVSVKDYFFYKRGPSFTIPDSAKPGIYARMREVAAHRALVPALAGTAALAVGVSLLETPCTAGFPVLWTGLLETHGVPTAGRVLLFGLYMIPFLVDELAIFAVAVVTMRAAKLQEKHGQLLKLVAGTTMLALAGTMLLAPEVMESVLGASAVFLAAGAVAAVIHLLATHRQPRPVGA